MSFEYGIYVKTREFVLNHLPLRVSEIKRKKKQVMQSRKKMLKLNREHIRR